MENAWRSKKKGDTLHQQQNHFIMPILKRHYIFSMLILGLSQGIFSQSIQNIDSLENVLKKEKTDFATLNVYFKKLDSLPSQNIGAKEILATWILANCSNKAQEPIKIQTLQILARNFYLEGNYTKATELFNETLTIGDENEYHETKCKALLGLSMTFYQTEQFDKQNEYVNKSVVLAEKFKYKTGIANAKLFIASYLAENDHQVNKDTFNLVFKIMNECLQLWRELKDTAMIIHTYTEAGQHYSDYNYFDSALSNMRIAAPLVNANKNINEAAYYYFMNGKIMFQKALANGKNKADLNEAIKYFNICIPTAKRANNKRTEAWCYDWLSASFKFLGNYEKAYQYLEKHSYLYGSLVSENNFRQLASIEHKYEILKKEKEILGLNSVNKQKAIVNKILIGSAAALLILSLLGYRNFKNKQKVSSQQQEIQQQKITELEKDKQLSAIDAMLKGQEEERSRIAKDLHDGLGGMLSGTKLSFTSMKENLVLTPENAILFDKSLSMLDNTIADLRKVAHNLMPEALVKFGLNEALRDFCNSIQTSSGLKVVYQQLGQNRKLPNTPEVFTYRIIQELVNNALKHANATQIIVQLNVNTHKLTITVEDDGIGFDTNKIANSKGAGMDNIKYRVQYFNGTLDIVTAPGNGTSVNIELMV